ncbi:MAG: NUDIX hydrolase [Pseudomonadota bacterium]
MKFCSQCGATLNIDIPVGDNRPRHICSNPDCQEIHYVNPKIIVCTLPVLDDKVLLCKRAIEPRVGFWTLPGGFMECAESTEQGAIRETQEEAGAEVSVRQLYRVFDMPHINQVYIIYLAEMTSPQFEAGEESLEVALFSESDVPWSDVAFTVMKRALEDYFQDLKNGHFPIKNALIKKSQLMYIT